MSAELAALVSPATAVAGGWFIFWMRLPRLVTAAAVAVAVVVALIRARREDIPTVVAALRSSVGRTQPLQTRSKVRGDDYVEGGSGNDKIAGHAGNDILSGGLGDDFIEGNEGSDKIYAGDGTDNVSGAGVNTPANANDKEHHLRSFANTDHTVTIVEGSPAGSSARPDNWNTAHYNEVTGTPGTGTSTTIEYDPRTTDLGVDNQKKPWGDTTTPSVVLYHEMAHANDFAHGTFRGGTYEGQDTIDSNAGGIRDGERVAVGLPIDHDNNPSTPEQVVTEHPTALTENAMRAELGLPLREHYDSQ
ncbi:M91 family zinc metallopeptidase [Nocardia fluminea]|uniref:M91 family zinc metallopeptidase n=1 Tax=Nocardia fluminea TaxID=134984 RepID=UPI0034436399